MDWRKSYDETSDEGKVLVALEGSEWDYRTIEGIAKETGLTRDRVRSVIEAIPDFIAQSERNNDQGTDLYYLKTQRKLKRFLARIRSQLD